MQIIETVQDVTQLQHLVTEGVNCDFFLLLETDDFLIDVVIPLKRSGDLDFYYSELFSVISKPPKPLAPAGFGFIDKNLANFDIAKNFGDFTVVLWLRPSPEAPPRRYTASLVFEDKDNIRVENV